MGFDTEYMRLIKESCLREIPCDCKGMIIEMLIKPRNRVNRIVYVCVFIALLKIGLLTTNSISKDFPELVFAIFVGKSY